MPMKRRKYAEGGLVVSRGGRDTSGLRLFDDTPAAGIGTSRAIAEMVANDEVSARPTMEELQAANLAAVRAREARETAKPARRQAPAPPKATTQPKRTGMSDAEIRAFMRENDRAADASLSSRRTPKATTKPKRTGNNADAVSAALLRQMQGRGPLAGRTRPPAMLALKKGGPVKKADLMKKMAAPAGKKPAAKADKAKKAMPMALMMAMAVPAKGAKKPVKKAAGGAIKQVKGYAMGGKVGCGHKGMKKK